MKRTQPKAHFALGFLLSVMLGCPADPNQNPDPDPDPDPDPKPTGPCDVGFGRPPVDEIRTLTFQNEERSFLVHVPASYQNAPTPIVFNFHGFTSSGASQAEDSKMIAKSDLEGFISVHPEGLGDPQRWNAGACCDTPGSPVDDVGFTSAMIDALSQDLCVDAKRVYAAGFSNGGFLANRLGCELSDRIAAIAPVSGVTGIDLCAPPRPVPVLHFHGTSDPVVPFNGNIFLGFIPVQQSVDEWATRSGCQGAPVQTFSNGNSTCQVSQSCQGGAEVGLCIVSGGGHDWPRAEVGADMEATDLMWDFFLAHPLP